MTTPTIHISRSFVEFGPFLPEEIVQFEKRGLLRDIDHIRVEGEDSWCPVAEWLASIAVKAPKTAVVSKPAAKPKTSSPSKAATAKKAAAKPATEPKAAPKRKAPKSA
jgi:hypothetical protein